MGIPTAVVPRGDYADAARYEAALHAEITAAAPGLIVLGGFLSKLSPQTVAMYPNRILNIHPGPYPGFQRAGILWTQGAQGGFGARGEAYGRYSPLRVRGL